jgi:hypothetical protein
MKSVLNKPLKKGDHHLNISIGDLPNGIYLIKLSAGLNTSIRKLVVY